MSRTTQFLLGFAFLLLGLVALILKGWSNGLGWWVHGIWCALGLTLTIPVLYRVLKRGFFPIVQNHFVVFAAAFTLFNLVGALLPVVGPDSAAIYALSYYPIGPLDALRVDAANGIGFGTALMFGAISVGKFTETATRTVSRVTSRVRPKRVVAVFLAIGVPATLYVLSVDLGVREGPVAGIWRSLAQLTLVAAFAGILYRGRGERRMMWLGLLVALAESATGLLLLSKMAVFLPLMVVLVGLSIRFENRLLVPAGIILVLILFGPLGGIVRFGRAEVSEGMDSDKAIQIRRASVNEGLRRTASGDLELAYHGWSRFYYTSAQAAAMDFYDQGNGGSSFRLVPWLFVPRAIASDKPVITQEAVDFHTKITGQTGSSTGQGIFISAFYNGGWIGLLVVSGLCGWILAQTSAIARVVYRKGDTLLLPLALIGVFMAFQISNHFLPSYFGPSVLIGYLLTGGLVVSGAVRSSKGGRPA